MDAFEWGYVVCAIAVIVFIIIAIYAQVKVQAAYSKYSKVQSSLNMTGSELVSKLSLETGVNVKVRKCSGNLTDNYDPRIKTLNISENNYSKNSIAGQAVVAHEFGHAMQDAKKYFPLKIRQLAIKLSQFASSAFIPLLIVGIILEIFLTEPLIGNVFIYCIVGIYLLSFLVNLITVPVEYNASRRAKKLLQENAMYSKEEMVGVNEVLDAAALTYVASLLISMALLARFILILFGSRR